MLKYTAEVDTMIIKARIIDNTKIELLEDAKAGDIIDLKELVDVDLSFLNNKIASEATALYQKNINEQYELKVKSLENEKATALKDLTQEKEKIIADLKVQIESEKQKYENTLTKEKSALTLSYEKQINELNNTIKLKDLEKDRALEQLTNKKNEEIAQIKVNLDNKDKDMDAALKDLEYKLNTDFNKKLSDKQNELIKKDAALSNLELKLTSDYGKQINELKQEKEQLVQANEIASLKLKNEYQEQINNLNNQIDNLKLAKSSLNVKKLGEELEHWCNEEYLNYASIGFKNCLWEKDNDAIKDVDDKKGTKADYIFKVYLDNTKETTLTSVCCEMKNEDPNSVNKKKNSDHFAKLDKDRTKKGCEYALLVSELEWDSANDAPIKVVPDYPKMYLVRPPYFIAFLAIIYNLAEKYRDLLLSKNAEALALKDKQELALEFEGLIKTYINDPIDSLNKKIEDILKSSEAITKANQKIIDTCNEVISKTINRIKEKVTTLEIKKLPTFYRKLDKINSIDE